MGAGRLAGAGRRPIRVGCRFAALVQRCAVPKHKRDRPRKVCRVFYNDL